MKKYVLFWIVMCALMPFRNANAYLVLGNGSDSSACEPAALTENSGPNYSSSYAFNSSTFASMGDNQYLVSNAWGVSYNYNGSRVSFLKTCSNLGSAQENIAPRVEIYSGTDYITVNESDIKGLMGYQGTMGGWTDRDENKATILIKTNVPGLFYIPMDMTAGGYPPGLQHFSGESKNIQVVMAGLIAINKEFKGIPPGTVVSYSPIQFVYTDDSEPTNAGHQQGKVIVGYSAPNNTPMDIKLAASCQYTLSDSGNIDFGDQRVSQITDNRDTTVKRSMTLNMNNCYGVNKVKTYITTTGTTSDSGLLLNNSVSDGAKNVAVALRVNPSYTESGNAGDNAGKDMYFDSSNPLEWNFGNAYLVTSLSKNIPLDVYLLRTGGEPTPGDYHATATIMMDFI